jgi:hypothetical protein
MYDLLPLKAGIEKKLFVLPKHVREIPIEDFDRHANQWLTDWLGHPKLAESP